MSKRLYYALIGMTLVLIATVSTPSVKAARGTGVLYVYTDTWGGSEAPKDSKGTYYVTIGNTYYIRITGITEFDTGTLLQVKIGWTDDTDTSQTTVINDVPVNELSDGTKYVDVEWTVPPNAKVCTTTTVHYKGDSGPDYIATGQISNIGHMHVIPVTLLGTAGALSALLAGLGLYLLPKKKIGTS